MNCEEYYGIVRKYGLKPSLVPHIYVTASGDVQRVPDCERQTPAQRHETIEFLKEVLGITD
jgi:hypothetical protein